MSGNWTEHFWKSVTPIFSYHKQAMKLTDGRRNTAKDVILAPFSIKFSGRGVKLMDITALRKISYGLYAVSSKRGKNDFNGQIANTIFK